jgi:hypothetical protein
MTTFPYSLLGGASTSSDHGFSYELQAEPSDGSPPPSRSAGSDEFGSQDRYQHDKGDTFADDPFVCLDALPCHRQLRKRWKAASKRPCFRRLLVTLDWTIFFIKLAWAIYVSLKVSGYYSELQDVKSDLSSVTSSAGALSSSVGQLDQRVSEVSEQVGQVENLLRNSSIIEQMHEAEVKYASLLNETESMLLRVNGLNGSIRTLSTELAADFALLSQQSDTFNTFNLSFSQQLAEASVEVANLRSFSSLVFSSCGQLNNQSSTLSAELRQEQAEITKLLDQFRQVNESLSQQVERSQNSYGELSRLTFELLQEEISLNMSITHLTEHVSLDAILFNSSYSTFQLQLQAALTGVRLFENELNDTFQLALHTFQSDVTTLTWEFIERTAFYGFQVLGMTSVPGNAKSYLLTFQSSLSNTADTTGGFNFATNVFTAPREGYWRFEAGGSAYVATGMIYASLKLSASSNCAAPVFERMSEIGWDSSPTGYVYSLPSLVLTMYLTKGDQVVLCGAGVGVSSATVIFGPVYEGNPATHIRFSGELLY